jgi:hypothetical protein
MIASHISVLSSLKAKQKNPPPKLAAGSGNSRMWLLVLPTSRQRNTAAKTDAPPVPGGVDYAAVVIGRFHLKKSI